MSFSGEKLASSFRGEFLCVHVMSALLCNIHIKVMKYLTLLTSMSYNYDHEYLVSMPNITESLLMF